MVQRLPKVIETIGNYFAAPKTDVQFTSSGCHTLDLALGGGWAESRVANIIGDKSSGKTLLAIEAASNFARKYPRGKIRFRETESAFQKSYAEALGMPIDRVDFGDEPLETVEDLFEDLDNCISKAKGPELHIIDSLDALSDRAEMKRDMDAGSYGAEKAKKMSQLFRRSVRKMSQANITWLVISQIRSRIGQFGPGPTTIRSGGRALDFYASQVVNLAQLGKVSRSVHGLKRTTGVIIRAKVEKNKVALNYRDATFEITFAYGINDIWACLSWLKQGHFLGDLNLTEKGMSRYSKELMASGDKQEIKRLHAAVTKRWYEVEQQSLPPRPKYG